MEGSSATGSSCGGSWVSVRKGSRSENTTGSSVGTSFATTNTPPSSSSDRILFIQSCHPKTSRDVPHELASQRVSPGSTSSSAVSSPAEVCPAARLEPLTDEELSDLLISYEPLSLLDSSAVYTYLVNGHLRSPKQDDMSPGRLKKALFLRRLDRRGVSHSDPAPLSILR